MKKGISSSTAKLAAIIAMAINHIGHVFIASLPNWFLLFAFAVGGLTFPIMAYMATEGYKKTSDRKAYIVRLAIFALISAPAFWLAFGTWELDVLFTILFGVLSLYFSDIAKSKLAKGASLALMLLLSAECDWAVLGVLLIYSMGKTENDSARAIVPIACMFVVMEAFSAVSLLATGEYEAYLTLYFFGSICAIPLLLLYNREFRRGFNMKYMFYAFYPGHLFALYFLSLAIYR